MRPNRPGAVRETATALGNAAAEDIEAFRALFLERRALESTEGDLQRQESIRREMAGLAPAVQRHLEALGSALVVVDDPSAPARASRQPLPLTYVAAFGAREDYEAHAESLAGALETAAHRFRSGEGGAERLHRRRRRRTSHRQRTLRRASLWVLLGLTVVAFYVAGLRAFGDWGGPPDSAAPLEVAPRGAAGG